MIIIMIIINMYIQIYLPFFHQQHHSIPTSLSAAKTVSRLLATKPKRKPIGWSHDAVMKGSPNMIQSH